MPVPPSSPIHPVLADVAAAADAHKLSGTGLLAALATVPDPRKRRGVRHSITTILALAVCAVLAGCRSFTAIGEWAANASDQTLAALEVGAYRASRRSVARCSGWMATSWIPRLAAGPRRAPNRLRARDGRWRSTAKRCAAQAAAASTHGTYGPRSITEPESSSARSMSSTRPTRSPDSPACARASPNLTDAVVTADALHAQRSHADYLVLRRGSHYLLTVKGNQPGLHNQLTAMPWKDVPPAHTSADRAHGRVEQRIVKVVRVQTGIVFPHAHQAIQIIHKTRRLDSTKWTTEITYAVTSLAAEQATAVHLANWIRGHWAIENCLHWVRDVTYDEDRSPIRTSTGPRAMASLRNLALSVLRIADDATNIAQAIRHHTWDPLRPVTLLLTS